MTAARWVLAAISVFVPAAVSAGAHCTGNGPCGPVGLEWATPQGFAGADFRPNCAVHDRCYSTPGVSRRDCDLHFRQGLHCACNNSRHPVMCHMTAETMFVATRLFGGPAFRGSQRGWYTNQGLQFR
jgi:hypothetical protein